MEALSRTWAQFIKLFLSLSPSQRITYTVIPLLIMGAFGFLIFRGETSSHVAISWGKVFTTDELTIAQQTLIDAGLTDFHTKGQRLMVPAADADKYLATVMTEGGISTNWGSELGKQFANEGMFTSSRQSQQRMRIALANELSRVIQAIPAVEQASVTWARSEPRGWPRRGPKVTATINVKPKGGQPLSMQLVHSMQMAVANMVPDLAVNDVTVFDIHNGKTYKNDDESNPYGSKFLERIEQLTRHHKGKLIDALSYIPDVLVTVNVDIENIKSSIERNQKINPKTVTFSTDDTSSSSTNSQSRPGGQPGSSSNQAHQLANSTGGAKRSSTKDSQSSTRSAVSFTVTETALIGAMPKAVQVSVQIPEEYYKSMLAQQGVTPGDDESKKAEFETALTAAKATVEKNVKETVLSSIPSGSNPQAVRISSYVRVDPKQIEISTPFTQTMSRWVSNWGSSVALSLFALWALSMLKKSAPVVDAVPESQTEVSVNGLTLNAQTETTEPDEPELEPFVIPESKGREKLQFVVRDNPEMTAAVLEKWVRNN